MINRLSGFITNRINSLFNSLFNSLLLPFRHYLSHLWPAPYEPDYITSTGIPPELQDKLRADLKFGILDRLTLIFSHYFLGPLAGFNLRIFVPDRHFTAPEKLVTLLSLTGLVSMTLGLALVFPLVSPLFAMGLLFLLFCPQWLYAFASIQHTVFEYRGYLFSAGIASILAFSCNVAVDHYGQNGVILSLPLLLFWYMSACRRNLIYTDPLLFWKQAHLDVQTDNLIASAYIYQLQKRERFGEIDDLHRWMTEARIPDCRAFLLNLAAAKFGPKSDLAPLDKPRLLDALKILEETARQWPGHGDVWRNLGTVQYYVATLGGAGEGGAGGGASEGSGEGNGNGGGSGEISPDYSMRVARNSFYRALQIQPKDSLAYLAIGHCYMYEGAWPDAVDALTNAYNYLPAGAYLVEDISLVRVKLMEALERAADAATDRESVVMYRTEFNRHQKAFEEYNAFYVTDENARYLI